MKKINISLVIVWIVVFFISVIFFQINKNNKVFIANTNSYEDLSNLIRNIKKDNVKNIDELNIKLKHEWYNDNLIKNLALIEWLKIKKLNIEIYWEWEMFDDLNSIPFLNVGELTLDLDLPNTNIKWRVLCDVFKMDNIKNLSVTANKTSNLEIDIVSRCLDSIKNKEKVNLKWLFRSDIPENLELYYCKKDFTKANNIKNLNWPKCSDIDINKFYETYWL